MYLTETITLCTVQAIQMQVHAAIGLRHKAALKPAAPAQMAPEARLAPAGCGVKRQPKRLGLGAQGAIEQLAHLAACAVQPRLQRADREAQTRRDLALRPFLE